MKGLLKMEDRSNERKKIGFYDYTVILTYTGFLFAFMGILRAVNERYWDAVVCLLLAGICDMFDGAVASTKKRNKQEKQFGIQIDSLSDLVSFGILPAVFVYMLSGREFYVGILSAIYALCALIRLAYFNVLEEERQEHESGCRKSYLGLPVTTVAICLPAIYMIYDEKLLNTKFAFSVMLAVLGVAFLLPVEIKKPKIVGKLVLIIFGTLEAIGLLYMALWGAV